MGYEMKVRGKFPMVVPKEYPGSPVTGMNIVRTGFDIFEHWEVATLAQEKMDGWFGVLSNDLDGAHWGHGWQEYHLLQESLVHLKYLIPQDSVVVGEVMFGTPTGAKMLKELGHVKFFIHDVLKWKGVNVCSLSAVERLDLVTNLCLSDNNLVNKDRLEVVRSWDTSPFFQSRKEFTWSLFKRVIEEGGEGLILKDPMGVYTPGEPTKGQWKIKKYVIESYVVLGFEKSQAETYNEQGMDVASIIAGLYVDGQLREITRTSGFDFTWRKRFSDHPEEYVGKVFDIGGFEVFKGGAIRHSSFLWMRPDRSPDECTL